MLIKAEINVALILANNGVLRNLTFILEEREANQNVLLVILDAWLKFLDMHFLRETTKTKAIEIFLDFVSDEVLEELQKSENETINKMTLCILEKFLSNSEENEDIYMK